MHETTMENLDVMLDDIRELSKRINFDHERMVSSSFGIIFSNILNDHFPYTSKQLYISFILPIKSSYAQKQKDGLHILSKNHSIHYGNIQYNQLVRSKWATSVSIAFAPTGIRIGINSNGVVNKSELVSGSFTFVQTKDSTVFPKFKTGILLIDYDDIESVFDTIKEYEIDKLMSSVSVNPHNYIHVKKRYCRESVVPTLCNYLTGVEHNKFNMNTFFSSELTDYECMMDKLSAHNTMVMLKTVSKYFGISEVDADNKLDVAKRKLYDDQYFIKINFRLASYNDTTLRVLMKEFDERNIVPLKFNWGKLSDGSKAVCGGIALCPIEHFSRLNNKFKLFKLEYLNIHYFSQFLKNKGA